ncbi:MAG: UDP-N-acetylmuramoyl-L-alanine--D-glutamate ligase [Gammaproteobacteria bacterium]|nr:UDP-N-acetylmuramoyl-L-alanine--D-glutamate ligase [Gammaproteobacteria bacterium]
MTLTDNTAQAYTLVVGLGVTGLSVARYLTAKGQPVVIADSRAIPPGIEQCQQQLPEVPVMTGEFDPVLFENASQLIISPGVALTESVIQQAMKKGIEVIGDIELFAREVKAPVIAITGSNGKSTVTTLMGEMAKQAGIQVAVGGNIGVPALDLLDDEVELYVLELSSFQLETLRSLKPVAATVLNLSADHQDRYDSFMDYARAKARIFTGAETVVVNRDDEHVMQTAARLNHVTGFTLQQPQPGDYGLSVQNGEIWLCRGTEKLIKESELKLGGRHNTANVLAALAMGEAANIARPMMLKAIEGFTGLPHRTQWVAETNGVSWFNDSKGTNVGATLAAIEGLTDGKNLILIAGGLAKDADFSVLKPAVATKVKQMILIGQDAGQIELALAGVVEIHHAESMQQAVQMAAELADAGDSVLLSPACASFDMFKGFEHRGEVFMAAVEALR